MKPLYRALLTVIIYIAAYVVVRLTMHREIEWIVVGAVAVVGFVLDYVLISVFEYAAKSGDEK